MACRVCPHHPARLHPPLPVLRRDTGPSPSPIPTLRPSHCPPLCQPEGSAALGVPGDGSTHRAGQEHPSSPGTGGISSPAVLCGRGWQRGPREQGDSVGDGGRWAGGGGGGGNQTGPPHITVGVGSLAESRAVGQGAPPGPGEANGAEQASSSRRTWHVKDQSDNCPSAWKSPSRQGRS